MASERNDILVALKTLLCAVSGFSADFVHLGAFPPENVAEDPHLVIIQDKESPRAIDGEDTERLLTVEIGLVAKIDLGKIDESEKQVNEIYDKVHKKLESVREGLSGKFSNCDEVPGTLEFITFTGKTRLRYCSCFWQIAYTRPLGGAE